MKKNFIRMSTISRFSKKIKFKISKSYTHRFKIVKSFLSILNFIGFKISENFFQK